MNRTTRRRLAAAAFGAVLASSLGWVWHQLPLGRGLELLSYNLLLVCRGDRPVAEAAIIYLDEISHRELNQPLNAAWDRGLHARLIERLTRAGARAIVFDIVFSDENPAQAASDARLVAAVKASGRVILSAENVRSGPRSKTVVPPFGALMDAAAGIGSVELVPSRDLMIRVHTPENPKEDQIPHLSWATAEFLQAPATHRAGVRAAPRWINYYGPPGAVPGFSYHECLEPGRVPDSAFRDRVIFVGARLMTQFAGDRKDEYLNPYSFWVTEGQVLGGRAPFTCGVEIQATMCLNLLRGDWLTRWSPGAELALLLLLGAAAGAGLAALRPVKASMAALAGAGLVFIVAYAVFAGRWIWFPWVIGVSQIGAALVWSVLFNSVQLYAQKRMTEQTLALYLSPKLVTKFAGNPSLLKPGAEEHQITIFFSDLEDFTSWSRELTSEALATLMNRYFETAVSQCVHRTDGTLVKYIGDAIFSIWNAPDAQPDHAWRACAAALGFGRLPELRVNGRLLRTRIGIHTGTAHVGNFGSADRVDYTALGENVNLASRLEGLNKLLGTSCLISRATQQLVQDRAVTRRLGTFQLKGFDRAVEVFELVDVLEAGETSRAWREAFADALALFESRRPAEAAEGFHRMLELRPGDGAARFYLERIQELRDQPPESWAMHTVVREK